MAVEVVVADLSDERGLAAVQRRLADRSRPVDLLVNNAGVEGEGEFAVADVWELQAEIDTNVTAVMRLTRAAVPGMTERGRGGVINVASFAGYLAGPGNAYAATKAWVLTFTDTVSASLAGTGVGMIALCAGRMRTGKHPVPEGASAMWLEPEAVVDGAWPISPGAAPCPCRAGVTGPWSTYWSCRAARCARWRSWLVVAASSSRPLKPPRCACAQRRDPLPSYSARHRTGECSQRGARPASPRRP